MTRFVPAALMLLLVAGPAAGAELRYHSSSTVYGCVDPRATVELSGRDGFLHRDGWAAMQQRRGRCFTLTPRLQLEVISRHGRMVLVRRVPPLAGEPPLSVMAKDLRVFAAPGVVGASSVGVVVAETRPAAGMMARETAMAPVAMPVVAARPAVDADAPTGAGPASDGSAAGAPVSGGAGTMVAPSAAVMTAQGTTGAGSTSVVTQSAPVVAPTVPASPGVEPVAAAGRTVAGAGTGGASGQASGVGTLVAAADGSATRAGRDASGQPGAGASASDPGSVATPAAAAGAPGMPAGPGGAAGQAAVGDAVPGGAPGPKSSDAGTGVTPVRAVPPAMFPDPNFGRGPAPIVAPAPPAVWPPPALRTSHGLGPGLISSALVTLLLLPFIVGAFMVSRRRRRFSHVEDGPLPRYQPRTASLPTPGGAAALESPQAFRQNCAEALQEAGWTTRLTFPGDGSGPDIVGQRGDSVIAVRCRVSGTAITGEMVDEAATMGARQAGSMTVLASNAPFSQRARDEAFRQRVHLLRDSELDTFVG